MPPPNTTEMLSNCHSFHYNVVLGHSGTGALAGLSTPPGERTRVTTCGRVSTVFFPIASGHGHRSPFEAALSRPEVEPEAQGGGRWDWHSLLSTRQRRSLMNKYCVQAPLPNKHFNSQCSSKASVSNDFIMCNYCKRALLCAPRFRL